MLTVLLTDFPLDAVSEGRLVPPYTGARIARFDFIAAMINARSDLHVVFVVDDSQLDKISKSPFLLNEGASALTPRSCIERYGNSRAVLHSLGTDLRRPQLLRLACPNAHWICVGLTHDLSDPAVLEHLLLAHVGNITKGDGIFCCSAVAFNVMTGYLNTVRGVMGVESKLTLPIIAHGIKILDQPDLMRSACSPRINRTTVNFLYFGRFNPATKADLKAIIKVFHALFYPRVDVHLTLAGGVSGEFEAAYVQDLKATCYRLGIHKNVFFYVNPTTEEKHKIFLNADIFISPANSLQETFGISLLEAMAYQLPVVASDWSGYRDIVEHGTTGYLFPTFFNPSSTDLQMRSLLLQGDRLHEVLTACVSLDLGRCGDYMRVLAADPELRATMGVSGFARVKELFDLSVLMQQHIATWYSLLAEYVPLDSTRASKQATICYEEHFRFHSSKMF